MSNFVSLEEAAKKLGVSAEALVEMRSRGEIFGYRDGGSWKFKPEEIERVAAELLGDVLDEDPAGSSILVSDSDLGSSVSSHGSTIGSDVQLAAEGSDLDSDVELVADPGNGSDVRLVASKGSESRRTPPDDDDDILELASSDDDDDELELRAEDGDDLLSLSDATSTVGSDVELGDIGSAINIGSGTGVGSDLPLGSDDFDLEPSADASHVMGGDSDLSLAPASDLIQGDSDPAIGSGLNLVGSDLELADDGDLVLGGGSDLALGSDSGINLMSPSDSGISLEDEPLDLAASGISGLDLAIEGSDVGSGASSGSGVDFMQDEEFQLSPSGALETDDDSGSQVIELEDSSEFGDAAVALPTDDGFDAFADVDSGGGLGVDGFDTAPAGAAVIPMGSPEVPYNVLQVLCLLGILLLMCMSGILVTDVVRNMWAWSTVDNNLTSGFTDMILGAFGMK